MFEICIKLVGLSRVLNSDLFAVAEILYFFKSLRYIKVYSLSWLSAGPKNLRKWITC